MPEPEAIQNPNPSAPSLCEECGLNPWKYRCPGCSVRTCALSCVKAHKQRTSCTGKRSRSEPVPISQFSDDLLLSDYKFLEEGKRVADSARRTFSGPIGSIGFQLPTRLRILGNAARRRRTQVLFLSQGMAERERNQSRYDIRENTIFWTIEWRFNGTDVSLIDHGVDEYMNLHSLLEKHLEPSPWNHPLKPYSDVALEDLKIFIQKNPKGSKSTFRMLSIKAPLGKQMANIVLVEHPIIYVYLPSHNYDFNIDNDIKLPSNSMTDDPLGSSEGTPNSKSLYFREEQIQEAMGEGAIIMHAAPRRVEELATNSTFISKSFSLRRSMDLSRAQSLARSKSLGTSGRDDSVGSLSVRAPSRDVSDLIRDSFTLSRDLVEELLGDVDGSTIAQAGDSGGRVADDLDAENDSLELTFVNNYEINGELASSPLPTDAILHSSEKNQVEINRSSSLKEKKDKLPGRLDYISYMVHLAVFGILGVFTRYLLQKLFGPSLLKLTGDDSALYLDLPSNIDTSEASRHLVDGI